MSIFLKLSGLNKAAHKFETLLKIKIKVLVVQTGGNFEQILKASGSFTVGPAY